MAKGESPADLARRVPAGSYTVADPLERSGLVFARVRYDARQKNFEGGITPAGDILSLHRKAFEVRAWRNGRLIHNGRIPARSVSLVKAGVTSNVSLRGEVDIVQVFLSQEAIGAMAAELYGRPAQLQIDEWPADPTIEKLVEGALSTLKAGNPAEQLKAEILALQLTEHLVRNHCSENGLSKALSIRRGGLAPHQLRRLLDHMDANLHRDVRLAELASEVCLSPYHLIRAFHVETGMTPHQWLVRRRISRAKHLLSSSDLSIEAIANIIGYASQSAMTATFSRVVGVAPAQWRKRA